MITDEKRYLDLAKKASDNSPCHRSKVGAIIVKREKVIAIGINEPPPPQKNCAEIGWCHRDANDIASGTEPDQCRCFGCHAETNAIYEAARAGGDGIDGATMYVHGNTEICRSCRGAIARAGIKMVTYMSKHGEIERINVEYDWGINALDQKRKYDDWKESVLKERGSSKPSAC